MKVAQYEMPGDVSSVAATVPLQYWRNLGGKIRSELSAQLNHKSQSPFSVAVFSLGGSGETERYTFNAVRAMPNPGPARKVFPKLAVGADGACGFCSGESISSLTASSLRHNGV